MKYFYTTTSTSTTTTLTAAPSVAVNHLVIDLFSADQGRFGQILKWSFIQCPQQQQPNPVQWSRCKRGGVVGSVAQWGARLPSGKVFK